MSGKLQIGLILMILSVTSGNAGDITTGYSFSSGEQNVTHTKLNNSINNAVIGSSFYTGKSAVTTTEAGDLVLLYSSANAGLRKISALNLFISNLGIITNQTQDLTPATGDYVLTYDVSAMSLKKATLMDLVFTNTYLIDGRTNWATPSRTTTSLLAYDTGTKEYSKLTRSNLFYQFFEFNTWTNLPTANPTNIDTWVIFDSQSGSNRQTTLGNLLTNLPTVTSNGPTDWVVIVTNGVPTKISLNNFSNIIAGNLIATVLPRKFVSTPVAGSGITTASKPVDTAHGFAATPQLVRAVIVCTTANLNYSIGDEVNLDAAWDGALSAAPVFTFGNSTNIGAIARSSAANWQIANKTTGTLTSITAGSWSLKVYADYFP